MENNTHIIKLIILKIGFEKLKKIVVTGSSGFIGKHLVSNLLNKKYSVIGICKRKQKSSKNLISIHKDISKLQNSDIQHSFSKIVHTAALSNIKYCEDHPSKCYETNVNGTQRILEIARKKNTPVIFLSSSHVYGNPKKLPINETSTLSSESIYASSKIMCENLCQTYSNIYKMDVTIVRLFSVYGPDSPNGNLILKIISDIITTKKIKIGNLKPKRDFIFINDVIDALSLIINSQKKGFHIYNIGTGKSTSVENLSKLILKISKNDFPIISEKIKFRKHDVMNIFSDNKKFNSTFNWKPQISLYDGLKLTYDYYSKKS